MLSNVFKIGRRKRTHFLGCRGKASLSEIQATSLPQLNHNKNGESDSSADINKLTLNEPLAEADVNKLTTESNSNKVSKIYNHHKWTVEDQKLLIEAYKQHGSDWNYIAKTYFPARKPTALYSQWNHLKTSGLADKENLNLYSPWTLKEDTELKAVVGNYGDGRVDWKAILSTGKFPNKSTKQLSSRYTNVLMQTKRGGWTPQEDEKLLKLVQEYGNRWTYISQILKRPPNRIRARYTEDLAPDIQKGPLEDYEYQKLAKALEKYGEDWEEIQKIFPKRPLSQIKFYCRNSPKVKNFKTGPWDSAEIQAFSKALTKYGRDWIRVAESVATRGPIQCYRKYFSAKI
ncbi:hypothetical protein G9A89_007242 [Geosiphon pyriformis]|nr:hypothetical protein G9A89_007242 [Geosiphon pyriformis]